MVEKPAGLEQPRAGGVVQGVGIWGRGHGAEVVVPSEGDRGVSVCGKLVANRYMDPRGRWLLQFIPIRVCAFYQGRPCTRRSNEPVGRPPRYAYDPMGPPLLTFFVDIRHCETGYKAFPLTACVPF